MTSINRLYYQYRCESLEIKYTKNDYIITECDINKSFNDLNNGNNECYSKYKIIINRHNNIERIFIRFDKKLDEYISSNRIIAFQTHNNEAKPSKFRRQLIYKKNQWIRILEKPDIVKSGLINYYGKNYSSNEWNTCRKQIETFKKNNNFILICNYYVIERGNNLTYLSNMFPKILIDEEYNKSIYEYNVNKFIILLLYNKSFANKYIWFPLPIRKIIFNYLKNSLSKN